MIPVTRLNDKHFVVNVEHIRYVESTPDTMLTLIGGDRIMIKETPEQVVEMAIEYNRQIRVFRD